MSFKEKSRELISKLKHELDEARKAAEYWELMATTDDLTGLHNRRMLAHIRDHFDERSHAHPDSDDVTLLFIDLDDFGQLNKKYGDDVGDQALQLLGHVIRQNIRRDDIAIRKGGDEFVLFIMGASADTAAASVVQRLALLLDGGIFLEVDDLSLPLRGSIGVYDYNPDISPLENLKHADTLMRAEKMMRKIHKAKGADDVSSPAPCAENNLYRY
ncbi:MAG: GGDEF domain-containing protein [Pseudobdellovibrionaceae bacterium]